MDNHDVHRFSGLGRKFPGEIVNGTSRVYHVVHNPYFFSFKRNRGKKIDAFYRIRFGSAPLFMRNNKLGTK